MKAIEILNYIPKDRIAFLAAETKVDYKSKKLDGYTMFQLLLYSLITERRSSLRVMEEVFSSFYFQEFLSNTEHSSVKFNSISERLNTIDPTFFEKLFDDCFTRFEKHFKDKKPSIIRFDSTLISVSSKLLDYGFRTGGHKGQKKQIKFTLGLGKIIKDVKFFYEPKYNSEEMALKEAILDSQINKDDIVVFDRGIQARATYDEFDEKSILFVSRINDYTKYEIIKHFRLKKKEQDESLKITADCQIRLFNKNGIPTKAFLRLVRATDTRSGKELLFITNISKMDACEIADLYKKRWDIEVFFRFLKQELNLSHLVSRSVNGIKVMLYLTLILSILLSVYKNLNNLSGYKIPKIKFANELEKNLITQIVILCDGNPEKVPKLML